MANAKLIKRLVKSIPQNLISIRAYAADGTSTEVTIAPAILSTTRLSAVVQWHDSGLPLRILTAAGLESKFGQLLVIAYLGSRPPDAAGLKQFMVDEWTSADMTLQDPYHSSGHRIQVQLNRATWSAEILFENEPSISDAAQIPDELRNIDVGTILVEATSQFLLGGPFLSPDAIRHRGGSSWLVIDKMHD